MDVILSSNLVKRKDLSDCDLGKIDAITSWAVGNRIKGIVVSSNGYLYTEVIFLPTEESDIRPIIEKIITKDPEANIFGYTMMTHLSDYNYSFHNGIIEESFI